MAQNLTCSYHKLYLPIVRTTAPASSAGASASSTTSYTVLILHEIDQYDTLLNFLSFRARCLCCSLVHIGDNWCDVLVANIKHYCAHRYAAGSRERGRRTCSVCRQCPARRRRSAHRACNPRRSPTQSASRRTCAHRRSSPALS